MKTKIIYISGSEVFDMQDIRAAFDQVRNALGMGADTVLFGVPVDKADALVDACPQIPSVSVVQPVASVSTPEIIPDVAEPIIDVAPVAAVDVPGAETVAAISEPDPAPQKKSRGRPKSVKKSEKITDTATAPETDTTTQDVAQDTEKVVSILSVLTSKSNEAEPSDDTTPVDETVPDSTPDIDIVEDTAVDIEIETIDVSAPITDEISVIDDVDNIATDDASQAVSIDDMITNDTPVGPQEKTLEQLLESMTPLREDTEHEQHVDAADSFDTNTPDDTPDDFTDTTADDDATLEQLATEFAENQDKFTPEAKTENHGKIGKLKNILPFKKARRDDSGLMGDLFGWAGIAANDDDFAIPGFFTNAASKK